MAELIIIGRGLLIGGAGYPYVLLVDDTDWGRRFGRGDEMYEGFVETVGLDMDTGPPEQL